MTVSRQNDKPRPTALAKAIDLLARQEQSSGRLREKLRQRGYDNDEIDAAIEQLTAKKYLDDGDACAGQFQRLYEGSDYSVRQIKEKLRQRGFDAETIAACVPPGTKERELEAAKRCLSRKYRTPAEGAKMMRYLGSRGFSSSVAYEAVNCFAADVAAPDFFADL